MDNIQKEKQKFMAKFRKINEELNELEKAHIRNIKRVRELQTEIQLVEKKAKILLNI